MVLRPGSSRRNEVEPIPADNHGSRRLYKVSQHATAYNTLM